MRSKNAIRAGLLSLVVAAGVTGGAVAGAAPAPVPAPVGTADASVDFLLPPSKAQIAALFDQWNAALATGDAGRVADLYAPNAVLLPTVSNRLRTDRAGIVDYFEHFLKGKPRGVINQEIITVLDRNTAINTGVYTFTLTENGQQREVKARYTFVYERIGSRWLIVNHHSSAMPAS